MTVIELCGTNNGARAFGTNDSAEGTGTNDGNGSAAIFEGWHQPTMAMRSCHQLPQHINWL